MKRISTKNKILIPCIVIIALEVLDKENVLRIDHSIENVLWTIIFPVLLLISLVLIVWVYPSSKLYRELKNRISSKIIRFAGGALLVVLPAVILVSMVETTLGIYINQTAARPIVLVINNFRIRRTGSEIDLCIREIKFYYRTNTEHRLCIERVLGLPAISAKSRIAESGSLCVKGRENSVGAVVDQIAMFPNEGLNMDAKQLRCAQLFSDT